MEYTFYNTAEQADRAISGAYHALILAGTGLARLVNAPTGASVTGNYPYDFSVSGTYFYTMTGQNQWGRVQLSTF